MKHAVKNAVHPRNTTRPIYNLSAIPSSEMERKNYKRKKEDKETKLSMRTRKGQSIAGAKRMRIAQNCSSCFFYDRMRLSGGSREGKMMYVNDPFNPRYFKADQFESWDHFDALNDDMIISILAKVSASALCPADLINILLVNKRFTVLGLNREVLAKAAGKSIRVRAKNWSDSAHQFFIRCANADNLEACHFLGMIYFYCLANQARGIELLKKAAQGSHAGALYALAIIYFNGSGSIVDGVQCQCDPDSAVNLCIKAAKLGNIDALREIAYCLQQGFNLPCAPIAAHRLLLRANTLELIKVKNVSRPCHSLNNQRLHNGHLLLTNYGFYEIMGKEVHAASEFMIEWWWLLGGNHGEDGLNMCSNILCGRRETRLNGFRICSRCRVMTYCSHACQEMHWKMEHGWMCIGQNVLMGLV